MQVSPFELEQRLAWRRDDLMREAAAERLARQVRRTRVRGHSRAARVLYALAAWLHAPSATSLRAETDHPVRALTT